MAALFGNGRAGRSNSHLVEFKAGKMYLSGSMCHPDKRKGLLYAFRSDDSLIHVCWKDRVTAAVQDDLIVFPDDAVFKRVPECTTGRVYVLLFKSSARKLIIWMQEPRADKDEENCRRLNEVLSGSIPEASTSAGTALSDLASAGDLQTLLSSLNQQQLLRLLGGATGWPSVSVHGGSSSRDLSPSPSSASQRSGRHAGTAGSTSAQSQSRGSSSASVGSAAGASSAAAGASPAVASARAAASTTTARDESAAAAAAAAAAAVPAAAPVVARGTDRAVGSSAERSRNESAPTPSDGSQQRTSPQSSAASRISLGDLQQILSSLGTVAEPQYSLADVLPTDAVMSLVASDPAAIQALVAHLPSHGQEWPPQGTAAAAELRSTLASPQFVQALTSFGSAFSSGQLAPVISQFDLPAPCQEAATQGDLEKFAKALQEHCTAASSAKRKSDSERS